MDIIKKLEHASRKKHKTLILPESYDERVIEAAKLITKKQIAKIILIDTGKSIKIKGNKNIDIIDVNFSKQFAAEYFKKRKNKEPLLNLKEAERRLTDPLYFACMLLVNKYADAVVSGSVYSTGMVLKTAIQIVGLKKGNKTVSSFFLLSFPKHNKFSGKTLAFADCGVLPNPTAQQLCEIAIQSSKNYFKLTGKVPRTAFLSFSTKGSAKDITIEKVSEALRLTRKREPNLFCDGELQFDTAFIPEVAKRKDPEGRLKGNANVFIFPDLNSGNIAYKIAERIGGAIATGPIVQGLAKPVMDLSRGCRATDIFNMSLIAAQF